MQPSLLLHPLDFLGADDGLEPLKFFPGMGIPARIKLAWLSDFIAAYRRRFRVVPGCTSTRSKRPRRCGKSPPTSPRT